LQMQNTHLLSLFHSCFPDILGRLSSSTHLHIIFILIWMITVPTRCSKNTISLLFVCYFEKWCIISIQAIQRKVAQSRRYLLPRNTQLGHTKNQRRFAYRSL
jgi:hypothetical protein